jgi:hypothetical protein
MGNYLIIDAIASRGKPPVVAPNTGVGTEALPLFKILSS